MAFSVGTVEATIGANMKPFEQAMSKLKQAGQRMSEIGRSMTMRVSAPIAALSVAMLKGASDAEETNQKFQVVFSDISESAEKAAKSLQKSFGLSSNAARELLGDTGDILTGFGFTQESALDLSEQVNELAVDLASFTNFSGGAEGASKALTKAMLGEAESVKALGIVIRQDTTEYKELIKQIMRTEKVGRVQAKALAALKIATEQSKNAIGDFERTQESLANQTRTFMGDVRDLSDSFGKMLIPMATKIVSVASELVSTMTNLSDRSKKIILVFSGIAAAIGPVLIAVGTLTLAIGAISAPVAGVVAAIGLGAAAIITHWEDVEFYFTKGGGKTMWTDLQSTIKETTEAMTKLWQSFGDDLIDIAKFSMGKILSTIENIVWATSLLAKAANLTVDAFKNVGGAFASVFGDGDKPIDKTNKSMKELLESSQKLFDFIGADLSLSPTSSGGSGIDKTAKSIDRVRVASSKAGDELPELDKIISGMTEPARIAKARQELALYPNALLNAATHTMDFSHRMEQVGEQSIKAANAMAIATDIGNRFANSFGQGMSNIVVQGERVIDVLENIGKLLLSSAIQKGLNILLLGGLKGDGFFGKGGGLIGKAISGIGKAFGVESSATPIASNSELSMSRAFKSALDDKMNELTPEAVWVMGEKGRLGV